MSARDLARGIRPDNGNGPPYRHGQVTGFDFNSQPPVLFIDEELRPMRFLGLPSDYTFFDSVIWIMHEGAPLVIGRLPQMGGDLEAWHVVGSGGGEPAFLNSWVNFGSDHAVAAFYKQPNGWVRLKGLVKSGSSTIFTLPVGYRPPFDAVFTSVSNGTECMIRVDTSGNVSKPIGGSNVYVSLADVTFPTDWNRSQWVLPVVETAWSRSAQPNPTAEIFIRDDGWVWLKGLTDGTTGTRILVLPERSRPLLTHYLGCVDPTGAAFNRVDAFYKGVLTHIAGFGGVTLGGKTWFAETSGKTFVVPTLLNSWTNLGSNTEEAGYYVDQMGVCHLQGVVTGTNNNPIFNLPAGVRPLERHIFFEVASDGGSGVAGLRIDVFPNGDVQRGLAAANGYISLNGVSFRVEQ